MMKTSTWRELQSFLSPSVVHKPNRLLAQEMQELSLKEEETWLLQVFERKKRAKNLNAEELYR